MGAKKTLHSILVGVSLIVAFSAASYPQSSIAPIFLKMNSPEAVSPIQLFKKVSFLKAKKSQKSTLAMIDARLLAAKWASRSA